MGDSQRPLNGQLVMHQIHFLDLYYFSMFQVVQVNSVERYGEFVYARIQYSHKIIILRSVISETHIDSYLITYIDIILITCLNQ